MTTLANTSINYVNETSSLQNVPCDTFLSKSFHARTAKTIISSIILLSSLVGNVLIIIIVRKRVELRNTINYFIVNTAISDLLFPLTTVPVKMFEVASSSRQWPIGGTTGLILCKIKWFLQCVSIAVSIQSLVWIALDRFIAVVLPMKVHLISSRFRVFAVASTWFVAIAVNSVILYTFHLVEITGEIACVPDFKNTLFSNYTYLKLYTVVFQVLPLVAMTILYSVIAVTLRRQGKVLQCRAVHQKDQRKRRATKMSFCIMAAFYICVLPSLLAFLFMAYEIKLPCRFSQALWFFANLTLFLSALVNPAICAIFIQSYRLGLKDIFRFRLKRTLTTRSVETGKQEAITLQDIRIITWMAEN